MSADNWRECPKCLKDAIARKEALANKVIESYGKISAEEYLSLVAEQQEPIVPDVTLREDWDIFTDETGIFLVSYRCSCSKCGFSYRFKHEEQT